MERFDLRKWPDFASAGGDLSQPALIDQISIDSRRIGPQNSLFIPLPGKHLDGHDFVADAAFAGATYALVKKEWQAPDQLPLQLQILRVDDPLSSLQAICHHYRCSLKKTKVVMVVGSYGKTMVKDLLTQLCSQKMEVACSPESFNSQIGAALSLLQGSQKDSLLIIEAGQSQVGELERLALMMQPDYLVITHVGKKHLTTLGSERVIAEEIAKVARGIPKEGWVLHPADPLLLEQLGQLKCNAFSWMADKMHLPAAKFVSQTESSSRFVLEWPGHNAAHTGSVPKGTSYYFVDLLNIAVKAAWLLSCSPESIVKTLETYHFEPMRMEMWQTSDGAIVMNDNYSADPQSIEAALRHLQGSLSGRKIVAFGGLRPQKRDSTQDYKRIGEALADAEINILLIDGRFPIDPLIKALKERHPSCYVVKYDSEEELLKLLKAHCGTSDVLLIKGATQIAIEKLFHALDGAEPANQCRINLAAIGDNLQLLRHRQAKGTRIMMMAKALCYGTDFTQMERFWRGCGIDILGVAYVSEAIALRRSGVHLPIFVLHAFREEAKNIVDWQLEVAASDGDFLEELQSKASKCNRRIKVHLHVDTGMHRLGCSPFSCAAIFRKNSSSGSSSFLLFA